METMYKINDNISVFLVRFDNEDEIAYEINWHSGVSCTYGAIGDAYIEIMERAL